MKLRYQVVLTGAVVLGLSGLVASSQAKNSKANRKGTSVYHLFVKGPIDDVRAEQFDFEPSLDETNQMEWDEDLNSSDPAPRGYIDSKHNKQGNADNQRLKMKLQNLKTETSYQLLAMLGDDTNYTYIKDLETDSSGSVNVQYKNIGKGKSQGKGKALGHQKFALPAALNPVSDIRAMVIADVNTQAVMHVNLGDPEKLHYLVKRNLDNDGMDPDAMAALSLKANAKKSKFDIYAAGLDPNETYFLSLNDQNNEELTTDDEGNLSLSTMIINSMDVLDVSTIAIWDKGSNTVLSTTLVACPK
jgi:hypothetical protein